MASQDLMGALACGSGLSKVVTRALRHLPIKGFADMVNNTTWRLNALQTPVMVVLTVHAPYANRVGKIAQ